VSYTILSAKYANPEHTCAILVTEEAGAVIASEADTPDLWAQMNEDLASIEPFDVAKALFDTVVSLVQKRLDDFARTRGYDGVLSACTYATSTVPKFQAEGQYAVNARDAHWAACYAVLADVQAGGELPTVEEVMGAMPALEWPQ
jgi:hypothetical protein